MEVDYSEGVLLAAPVEFKRMLSWQLSTPSSAPITKRKRRRKKSQEAQKHSASDDLLESGDEDEGEELVDFTPDGDEITADYAYIYVNSDGEEEIYYSAPESPLTSEDDTPTDTHSLQLQVKVQEHRKKKSKRSKKKARCLARAAKVEFFQPLCDLVEDKLQVEVPGEMKMSSCAQVPSLAEVCIRKIKADTIGKFNLCAHVSNMYISLSNNIHVHVHVHVVLVKLIWQGCIHVCVCIAPFTLAN